MAWNSGGGARGVCSSRLRGGIDDAAEPYRFTHSASVAAAGKCMDRDHRHTGVSKLEKGCRSGRAASFAQRQGCLEGDLAKPECADVRGRSEERRVGKEWKCWWEEEQYRANKGRNKNRNE